MGEIDLAQHLLYFFFQAEDGIRDHCVTGVQTCALPILFPNVNWFFLLNRFGQDPRSRRFGLGGFLSVQSKRERSEERRVGKECRSRGPSYQSKETMKERSALLVKRYGEDR